MKAASSTRRASVLLLAALCCATTFGCPKREQVGYSVGQRRDALEARLAGLPASTEPATAVKRSRVLRALGRQDQALEELEAAVAAARDKLRWDDLAQLWREIGSIHLERGRPEQALDTFGKRLKAAASLDEPLQRATALVDTAYAFALLGFVGQADEAVYEAELIGGDGLKRDAATLERLGLVSELFDETDKARELLGKAAEAYRAQGDNASATRAQVYAAQIAAREGDKTALSKLDAAVQVVEDGESAALLRRFQAEGDLLSHNYDGCERRALEAIELADSRGLENVGRLARVIAARCAKHNGKLKDSIRHAREAASIVELQLRHVTGDAARQELGFEAFLIYRFLLTAEAANKSADRVERAFVTSERARARAHLDAVARSQVGALTAGMPVSAALMQNRAEAEDRVRRMTQALLTNREKRKGDAARHQDALWALEDIKEAIARQNPLLSRVAPPDPADVGQVKRELLDDDTLLISFFMADEQVFLFAIDRSSSTLHELPDKSEDIGRAVEGFRKRYLLAAGGDVAAVKKASAALFKKVLGPVADRIQKKRRLLVVPHGPLSSLPFESLVGSDGKFLVEDHDLSYSLSATLSLALAKRAAPAGGRKAFVAMGDPVYDWSAFSSGKAEGGAPGQSRGLELWTAADEEAAAGASRGLERLPGTSKEVNAIAKLFGADAKIYLRADANEENAKAGVFEGFRIVHVASHGLMAPHYQALALTIKPDANEDGFLMNSEIGDLKLDADMVVLSACRTGNTRARQGAAEPVAGLALSLRAAGARRVVLSLWSVDDEATADLMLRFYRPLVTEGTQKDGAQYSKSLSAAKREMIADPRWAHPFYWAAFVLHGS
jgi:CHAT domain-containing protein